MPYKEFTIKKVYYTIGQACVELNLDQVTVRWWCDVLNLKHRRSKRGDRYFTPEDLDQLLIIKHLYYVEGYRLNRIKPKLERYYVENGRVRMKPEHIEKLAL